MLLLDFTIPTEFMGFVLAAIGVVVGFIAWVARGYIKKYDDHLAECNKRNERVAKEDGIAEARMLALEHTTNRTSEKVDWLGECVVAIGTAVKADLPEKP